MTEATEPQAYPEATDPIPSSESPSTDSVLIGSVAEGGAMRRAAELFDRRGADLVTGLKRGVPFLTRRAIEVKASEARPVSIAVLLNDLKGPIFTAHLATDPGGHRAALFMDAPAVSFLLEGVLGGNSDSPQVLDDRRLSAPQTALISRVADSILQAISPVLSAGSGFKLLRLPPTMSSAPSDGSFIATTIQLGPDAQFGTITLAVTREAVLAGRTASAQSRRAGPDSRVVSTMSRVEIELIAELGRVPMTLGQLSGLKLGDVVRVDVPVSGVVSVRAENIALFEGVPTTVGTQLAIRIAALKDDQAGAVVEAIGQNDTAEIAREVKSAPMEAPMRLERLPIEQEGKAAE